MIELLIAAVISASTLLGTPTEVQTTDATTASTTTTTTTGNPGGTGSWDDGN